MVVVLRGKMVILHVLKNINGVFGWEIWSRNLGRSRNLGWGISQLLGLAAQKRKILNSGGIYCWDLYPKNSGSKSPQNTRYFRNHRARGSEILDDAGLSFTFLYLSLSFLFFLLFLSHNDLVSLTHCSPFFSSLRIRFGSIYSLSSDSR